MKIRKFCLGPYQTNGYLLSEGSKAVFIDPGDDSSAVLDVLKKENLTLTHILVTHIHIDHFYGAAKLARLTGAEILASADDAFLVDMEILGCGDSGYPDLQEDFRYTPIAEGMHEFLGKKCKVVPTPGHTPGGLTFHFTGEGVAFVGDLIFARSIGRTDFTGGNIKALMRSVENEIFTMPGKTVLYPGHGPSTTAGDEKIHNPFF
ncbi:glyoxylase-like metal-dependent hydrolase (beta-lactamase superfamily II) [Desulfobaculum xiamenense]|uniref:Glyoxylase-like metal-dependent hydrolase (Beta-lactamase superfamily II) n=1 Tax=Desulfobaculum xiamenense TaxID=995050 RepID=A0A846QDD7_9BACT|nr:MBL fold metallo-hydrolase [Desulfobaculum xiamenense]NJB66398.1 glyoxylase-like metal-dependent hydrolase (beta-lactamase superfamily II) [Desulfobaculum xiamenense]